MVEQLITLLKPYLDEEKLNEFCLFWEFEEKFVQIYTQMVDNLIEMFPDLKNLQKTNKLLSEHKKDKLICMFASLTTKNDSDDQYKWAETIISTNLKPLNLVQVWEHKNFITGDKASLITYLVRLEMLAKLVKYISQQTKQEIFSIARYITSGGWESIEDIKKFSETNFNQSSVEELSDNKTYNTLQRYVVATMPHLKPLIVLLKSALANDEVDEQTLMLETMQYVNNIHNQ
jgi:hypothetical protein